MSVELRRKLIKLHRSVLSQCCHARAIKKKYKKKNLNGKPYSVYGKYLCTECSNECKVNPFKKFWFRVYELTFGSTDLVRSASEVSCPECGKMYGYGTPLKIHFMYSHPEFRIDYLSNKVKKEVEHPMTARKAPKLNQKLIQINFSGKTHSNLESIEVIVEDDEIIDKMLSTLDKNELLSYIDIDEHNMLNTKYKIEDDSTSAYNHYLGKKKENLIEQRENHDFKYGEINELDGYKVTGFRFYGITKLLPTSRKKAISAREISDKITYSYAYITMSLRLLCKHNLVNYCRANSQGGKYLYWRKKGVDLEHIINTIYYGGSDE